MFCLACICVQAWFSDLFADPLPFDQAYKAVLISITGQEGIYRITGSDLSGAGIDITGCPADRIAVLYEGSEIPVIVSDGGDNSIGPDDYILFKGDPYKDSYTDTNVYMLGVLDQPGLRMTAVDYTPSGGTDRTGLGFLRDFTFEKDLKYNSLLPEQAHADHWYWEHFHSAHTVQDFTVDLGSVFTDSHTCSVTVHVTGITSYDAYDPDHHIVVYMNGSMLGQYYFDGRTECSVVYEFSQTLLNTGNNTIRIEVPQDTAAPYDALYLSRIDIQAASQFQAHNDVLISALPQAGIYTVSGFSSDSILVFDITGTPAAVAGYTVSSGSATLETDGPVTLFAAEESVLGRADGFHEVSSELPGSIPECDYIVITSPELKDAASGLAALHPELSVSVFDAYYLYAHFGSSRISPYPIRDFLTYCMSEWRNPPSYAVLAGDCANNRTGTVPSYYVYDRLSGVIPADNWFACVSGADAVPDISFGRIPADTETELSGYFNKIDAYSHQAPQGKWETDAVFIADNSEGVPEDSIFSQYNEELAAEVPAGYSCAMIHLEDYSNTAQCTADIISTINGGVLIAEYLGHGGTWTWAGEMIFADSDLVGRTDARDLFNADSMFPFFISITCLDGYFIAVDESLNMSLSERLLLNPAGGGIGVFSASGFADAQDKFLLGRNLYRAFFENDIRVIGDAVKKAKQEYTAFHQDWEETILHTHNLMGDPALELRIPSPRKPFGLQAEYYEKGELSSFSPVTGEGQEGMYLSWHTEDSDIAYFEIYRCTPGNGEFRLLARTDRTAWYDIEISSEREYGYYVVSVNTRALSSVPSETVQVSTYPDTGLFGCTVSDRESPLFPAALVLLLSLLCAGRGSFRACQSP